MAAQSDMKKAQSDMKKPVEVRHTHQHGKDQRIEARKQQKHASTNPDSFLNALFIILLFWLACVWLILLYPHMTEPTPDLTASAEGQR
jgi:hypothetical protein